MGEKPEKSDEPRYWKLKTMLELVKTGIWIILQVWRDHRH
jgi:hypothetical protein